MDMTTNLTIAPDPAADVAVLDILDPTFRLDNPAAVAAREAHWYARTPLGVAVLRYTEVAELARDPRLRQQGVQVLAMQGVTEGVLVDWFSRGMLAVEDDAHTRLRKLVNRAFTPRRMEALRPAMRELADRLVDGFAGAGQVDIMAGFADRYPIRVISRLFGLPDEDAEQLAGWADALGLMFAFPIAPHLPAIEQALVGFSEYADRLIAARRRTPGEDLISALVAAEADDDRLDAEELRTMVMGLIFAGHDTTRCQLGLAVATFLDHPDQWALLGECPEHAATAVEEVFRVAPAVPAIYRTVREELHYRDLHLPAGAFVLLAIALANTDPRAYGPDARFDITATRPPQLVFGGGPHYCLGTHLARLELREALPVLARRLRGITAAGPATWRPPLGITGPDRLPVAFAART